eukprot:6044277-Ditylum_brightwellii.AAC.1
MYNTGEDYPNAKINKEIDNLNENLDKKLDDTNFRFNEHGEFSGINLEDAEVIMTGNAGITHEETTTHNLEENSDMKVGEKSEDSYKDVIRHYLQAELNFSTYGEESCPIGCAHDSTL